MGMRDKATGGRAIAFVAILLMSLISAARGEIVGADSIEWMVRDSDCVIRCSLAETTPETGNSPATATLKIVETIKGQPAPSVTIMVTHWAENDFQKWRVCGGEKLVFLVRWDRRMVSGKSARFPYELRGEWTLREPLVGTGRHLIRPVAFTTDFKAICSFDDALAGARNEAQLTLPLLPVVTPPLKGPFFFRDVRPDVTSMSMFIDAPMDSDAFNALWSRSAVFLRVPCDIRLERLAIGYVESGDAQRRSLGLKILQYHKSPRSLELFRNSLSGRDYQTNGYAGRGATWRHADRELAFDTLTFWGEHPIRPLINMPQDALRPLAVSTSFPYAVTILIVIATLVLWVTLRRTLRRKGRFAMFRVLPSTLFDFTTVLAAISAVTVLLLDWRSRITADELTFSTTADRYWLSAVRGKVVLATAKTWPDRADPEYASFDLAATPASRWAEDPTFMKAIADEWWVLRRAIGSMTQQVNSPTYSGPGVTCQYVTWSVPLWLFAAVLGIVPLMRGMGQIRRSIRTKVRRRRGLCLDCGYDLHAGHERCPECGAVCNSGMPRSQPSVAHA